MNEFITIENVLAIPDFTPAELDARIQRFEALQRAIDKMLWAASDPFLSSKLRPLHDGLGEMKMLCEVWRDRNAK